MERFAIVMADDAGVTKYWDGSTMSTEKDACFLYTNKAEARSAMASLVSLHNDYDVSVRKATSTLTIE